LNDVKSNVALAKLVAGLAHDCGLRRRKNYI